MRMHVVEVVHGHDCPHAERAVAAVRSCLSASPTDTVLVVREGDLASPTVLVDGVDVLTGEPPVSMVACRLGVPAVDQMLIALERSLT